MSARRPPRPRPAAAAPPWDPLRDLLSLKDRMNRLFENVMHKGDFSRGEVAGWTPAVDLKEDREGYRVTAELPGVRREDVRLRIEPGLLTLEGSRPADPAIRGADCLRMERGFGPFSRSFLLPGPIDEARATARLERGVLEVFVPKAAESARTRPTIVPVG